MVYGRCFFRHSTSPFKPAVVTWSQGFLALGPYPWLTPYNMWWRAWRALQCRNQQPWPQLDWTWLDLEAQFGCCWRTWMLCPSLQVLVWVERVWVEDFIAFDSNHASFTAQARPEDQWRKPRSIVQVLIPTLRDWAELCAFTCLYFVENVIWTVIRCRRLFWGLAFPRSDPGWQTRDVTVSGRGWEWLGPKTVQPELRSYSIGCFPNWDGFKAGRIPIVGWMTWWP